MNPGSTIAGRFEVIGEARAGGMGLVLRARDRHAGADVAVKLVPVGDAAAAERFGREAAVLAQLSHPGIVRYVAHGAVPGGPSWLAMEWVEGETLAERLSRGPLAPREAVAVVRRAAEAVAQAHARGVVHRDLKPSNLVLPAGDLDRVKVLDFGIALSTRELRLQTGAALGTPGYVAPEQARGAAAVDARADVFALGCVLYECLTGRPAFEAQAVIALLAKILVDEPQPIAELRAGLPAALEDVLHRALAKDPALRQPDAAALAGELADVLRVWPDAGSGATPPPAIRSDEMRIVSVLLAGPAAAPEEDPDALRAALVSHGALVETLAGGEVVATLSAGGGAADQAARGARVALRVRRLAASRPLVLSTGRAAVVRGRVPVGQVLDRGARLLARAAPGAVELCEVTAALLDARFVVSSGPAGPILDGERAEEGTRTLLGRPTPCVGRDRELAALEGTFAECASEPVARAVLVTGTPGAGKSRILHEFLGRVTGDASRAPTVLLGDADPLGAGSAFGLLAPAIRRAAGIQGGEPIEIRREKLAARVRRHVPAPQARRVAEFLGEIAGVPFPDDDDGALRSARADAMLLGDAMRSAWEDWLRAECAAAPVILVLEDAHWGDLPSIRFVDVALRNLASLPLFVLALGRPEVETLFPSLFAERDLAKMRLAPLTRRAAQRLVREALGEAASGAVVDGIVARAEGNAFYLEELVRAIALRPGAAEGDAGAIALPDSVLGTVQAHLDALPAEARRVLRAASVYGERVTSAGVAALTGGGEGAAGDWLEDLAAREVLTRRAGATHAGEAEYGFRHDLVRQAAYAMLPEEDRRLAHRLAGEWLERRGDPDAALLAEHFDRGGEPARAATWYRRGAEQALGGNDLDAAIARADRGIGLLSDGDSRGPLLLVKAEALRWRGDVSLATSCAEEAVRILDEGSTAWLQAVGELIVSAGRQGGNDRVEELSRRVAACAPSSVAGASARIGTLCRGASQLIRAALLAPAESILERIEETLARGGAAGLDRLAQARVHRLRAKRALYRGDVAGFLRWQEACCTAFDLAGDARNACSERVELGFAYLEVGDLARAEAVLREVGAVAEKLGLHHVYPWAWNNLGTVLLFRGDAQAAREIEQRAVDAGVSFGDRRLEGGSRVNLSMILHRLGDARGAEAEAALAVQLLEPAPPRCAAANAALARALVAQGRAAEAVAPARAGMSTVEALGGIDEGESMVRLVWAEVLEATGDHAGSRAAILAARDRLLARAALIGDPRLRESFLGALPDNARTLVLAAAAFATST